MAYKFCLKKDCINFDGSLENHCSIALNNVEGCRKYTEDVQASILNIDVTLSSVISPLEDLIRQGIKVQGLSYGVAVELIKRGFKLRRRGWNGKGLFVSLVLLPQFEPFMALTNTNTLKINTWVASVSDTLAEDWEVVGNE